MLSLTYCSYSLAKSRICDLFFFMSVNLCCNESLFQKYFYGLSFNDSIAISISEKVDSSVFTHFDLLGEFLPFLWRMVVGPTGNINILKASHYEDNTPLIPTLITRPTYLHCPAWPPPTTTTPPHFPSLSGRPPASETLDSACSALSTKFRKPLATSNHYFRKRERAMTKGRKRTRERTRHTQKQGEISDFSCSLSLHYNNV